MCDTDDRADVTAAEALPASLEWKGEVLPLEPVDELSVLTVCDNVMDMLLPDEGPAKRLPLAAMARLAPPLEAPAILGGKAADVPLTQHGFSALVEVRKGGRVRRLLFDTGITPEPVWSNLKRSLANLAKQDIGQLTALVRTRLRRMQYRPGLLDGFLAKTGLDLTPLQ